MHWRSAALQCTDGHTMKIGMQNNVGVDSYQTFHENLFYCCQANENVDAVLDAGADVAAQIA
jgi:hypothetical protein